MTESARQGAEDGFYLLDAARRQYKHIFNECRDAILTESEEVALLEAYQEAGR